MKLHMKSLLTAATACAALATGPVSAATILWQGGTGNFADANWTVDGTPDQTHPAYTTGDIDTIISSGTVSAFNNAATGNLGRNDTLTISGGAAVTADFIRVEKISGSDFANNITLESGSITVSDSNAFRTTNIDFTGFINFTGAAGSATVVQTNNTGSTGQELAGKISASSGTLSYFSIAGTMISSGVTYDGTNLAAVNAGLASNDVGGLYFFIEESSGTQTLTLVPEPGSLALLGLGGLLMARRRRG